MVPLKNKLNNTEISGKNNKRKESKGYYKPNEVIESMFGHVARELV